MDEEERRKTVKGRDRRKREDTEEMGTEERRKILTSPMLISASVYCSPF